MTAKRRILVTNALPYANGPIHLGHLVGYIQADIWCRFQRIMGNECHHICADDAHGTAIMLLAQEQGQTPEQLIDGFREQHHRDFCDFMVPFDCYHSTHSPENRTLVEGIYARLQQRGDIQTRKISQLYDQRQKLFLADRYIRGQCPRCAAADQHGDNCEVCGATYSADQLIEPRSVLSGEAPVLRDSEHLFFNLAAHEDFLRRWTRSGVVSEAVANKLGEWLKDGLQSWNISRDAPYFGFPIPGLRDKYFYVWVDAPVGYMASFRRHCDERGLPFDDFWAADAEGTELVHFIGKDIINFHALFWPAILRSAGYRTPSRICVNGFLTVDGAKMSKSRGTFITARHYLQCGLPPEALRYYFASKLGGGAEDMDLSLGDFASRVNSDLVGKLVNIASRCARFVERGGGRLAPQLADQALWHEFADASARLAEDYESAEFGRAMRRIMALADRANEYIAAKAPWNMAKQGASPEQVLAVCSMGINMFLALINYLRPVLPTMAAAADDFLGAAPCWPPKPLLDHPINPYKPLLQRLSADAVAALVKPQENDMTDTGNKESEHISIDQFMATDLRAARVLQAEAVEGADKLLRLQLDVGDLGQRSVFSGIKAHYAPDDLKGRLVVLVANLAPRKMRFGLSQGMVLCAQSADGGVHLVSPEPDASPGDRVL